MNLDNFRRKEEKMTSKSVTNVSGMMTGFVTSGTGKTENVSSLTDCFSTVMQKTTSRSMDSDSTEKMTANTNKTDVQNSTKVMKENTKAAREIEKDAQTGTEQPTEEVVNTAKEEVQKTAEKVVQKVAETLGISEEEVEQAMETLGLTAVHLLDSTNLSKLMLNLSGESNMMALATNENLYTGMKDIMQFIEDELAAIQEMCGLNEAQMKECMETLNADAMQQVSEEIPESSEKGRNDELPVFDMREGTEETVEQPEEAVVTITRDGKEVKAVAETDAKTGVTTITQELAPASDKNEDYAESNQKGSQEENSGKESSQNGNVLLQELSKNQNATAAVNNTQTAFTETQVQDIMDQIMDYIKVQVKEDTSNLEMQLHPESLGTLNIHISAKDGVLTAQFTTQNETVKSMIESQLITLQQNLNEQGIKVEAVEVNVATGHFDRNLNQGQESEERQAAEAKKKTTRRINLNDWDALGEEELEEADRVTADMMARNGNTVDYLA